MEMNLENKKSRHKKYQWKYEKTKKGFLVRLYRNMKSRVDGVQVSRAHLYKGKFLLSKPDFYKWALKSRKFHSLFKNYESSGYQRKFAPSVDRIDSSKGYFLANMEWVTQSENSRRGGKSGHLRKTAIKKEHSIFKRNKVSADTD